MDDDDEGGLLFSLQSNYFLTVVEVLLWIGSG
jgi:hypothetical protein